MSELKTNFVFAYLVVRGLEFRMGPVDHARQAMKFMQIKKIGLKSARVYVAWATIELEAGLIRV